MKPDPMPQTTVQTGDAVTPPFSLHPPKEMPMNRYHGCLKNLWTRVALCAAGLAMSATLLLAVGSAFYSVSSEAMLADSLEARSAVAACEARGDRIARQQCVRRLIARAQAQDAGASQVATLATPRRSVRP